MCKVAIFIKTLLKEKTIYNCIKSIQDNLSFLDYRIYIADDGPISSFKRDLYDNLKNKGHVVLELPYNFGASASRNALLNELNDEDFILRMDDDFEITPETNLSAMISVLNSKISIGVISDLERQIGKGKSLRSGRINPWQGFMYFKNDYLIKQMLPLKKFEFETVSGTNFAFSDFTRNMLLIKRDVFADISWDNNLSFFKEHEDFLLQLKHSNWSVAFTFDSVHAHRDDLSYIDSHDLSNKNLYIKENLFSKQEHYNYFLNKWNLKGIYLQRNLNIYKEKFLSLFG
jgi:GT2 family glycosyltransferase